MRELAIFMTLSGVLVVSAAQSRHSIMELDGATGYTVSATVGDVQRSALTMLAFGLGTLPAVMGVGIMTSLMTRLARSRWARRCAGLFMVLLAVFAAFPELYPLRMQTN